MPATNPKIESLYKILLQEQSAGYTDSTVMGGLDRFLQRWLQELEPVLGELSSYTVLTPTQREEWTRRVLAHGGPSDATATGRDEGSARPRAAARTTRPSRRTVSTVSLDQDVAGLKGISRQTIPKLKRLGVQSVRDLVYLFPHRHSDFASIRKIADLEYGKEQTVLVTVWEATETAHGPKRRSTQATLVDDTGSVRAIWFNQPYLAKTFKTGTALVISGKVGAYRDSFVFESPEYELMDGQDELIHTGRLVPVYPTVNGLPQRTLRRAVKRALDIGLPQLQEFLPEDTRHWTGVIGLRTAVVQMHYPDTEADRKAARLRLAFDELLTLQLAVLARRKAWQDEDRGIPLQVDDALIESFLGTLPFTLTAAQHRVLGEILADVKSSRPMSRLLQGDVGSGKTVVAAAALLVAASNGHQGALMAPTEILAEQHFLTVSRLFEGLTRSSKADHLATVTSSWLPRPVTIALLLGSLARKAKADLRGRIEEGEVDVVIGTHALIQGEVEIPRLALAVVDEQHRFGVMQRATLREKGRRPHLLAMSATPIPRSLALTVYGDLDVSAIDEMPPGRLQIRTRWVAPDKRDAAYGFVRKEVEKGRQAFVVCPLIDESEAVQARAATEEHERLSKDVFPDLRLALLHGRMALREKEQIMAQFQEREIDVLVSTPVVEVGIDVPNATVMLVDGAERFGLAQLHQFRGRVGRGKHQSFCLLLADEPGQDARERLRIVQQTDDGFELAEHDLRIRGPGDYLGTRQSGLPDLRVASIADHEILTLARNEANRLLESDPDLTSQENVRLGERMRALEAALADEMS